MKRYQFDSSNLTDLKKELYKTIPAIYPELVPECFTDDNLVKVINEIQRILDNPIVTEEEIPERKSEEITCFDEETNKKLNEIFSNKDLVFFGHGGAAEEIINSRFECKYPNLLSHFIQLEDTNESLSQFKSWPHKNCPQIAIMALNIHEYNPIYKTYKGRGSGNETMYSISNDYFIGYYDNDKGEFILNPNFKERHEYDEECTTYQDVFSAPAVSGPDEMIEFNTIVSETGILLRNSSHKVYLDEKGYKEVKENVLHKMKRLKELQDIIKTKYADLISGKKETVEMK